jgi:molecular chaperone DnaJ
MSDLYQTLGIDRKATDKDIKSAFHKLALEFHPDRNKDPGAVDKFKEITAAYETLSNPERRAKYDRNGDSSFTQQQPPPGFGGFGGFPGFNMEDLFGGFGGARNPNSVFRGEDIHKNIRLEFMEAISGCKKTVKLSYNVECSGCSGTGAKDGKEFSACKSCSGQGKVGSTQGNMRFISTCPACSGSGRKVDVKCGSCKGSGATVKDDKLTMTIPAGIEENTTMRLQEKGLPGVNGGPSGDLYVSVSIAPHSKFRRKGSTIHADETIDYLDALLGADRSVETIHGPRQITIPPSTQHGSSIRVPSGGVCIDSKNGEHVVTIKVKLPDTISAEEKQLLESLRAIRSSHG